MVIAGAVVVVLAGLFIAWRERRHLRGEESEAPAL
jgi:hypothetical protein